MSRESSSGRSRRYRLLPRPGRSGGNRHPQAGHQAPRLLLPRRPQCPLVDARPVRLFELHRYRRHDVHDRRAVLPRHESGLGHSYLLGLVHHLLLHGLSGQVDPPLRRHDLRRVECHALRRDARRRGGPSLGRAVSPCAHDLQPHVHLGRHRQVRRGIPALRPDRIHTRRPGRRRRLCHAGRLFRRHPHRHPADFPHRRRRRDPGHHGLQPGRLERPGRGQGPGLVFHGAVLDALAGLPGDDAARLPAFSFSGPDHAGGVPLADLPGSGRAQRLGFPVFPDHPVSARRPAGRRHVDRGLHPPMGHRLGFSRPRHPVARTPGRVRCRENHAACSQEPARRASRRVHGRASRRPDVHDQRHDQCHKLGRHQRLRQTLFRPRPVAESPGPPGPARLRRRPRPGFLFQPVLHRRRHGLGNHDLHRRHGHPRPGHPALALLAVQRRGLRLEHGGFGRAHPDPENPAGRFERPQLPGSGHGDVSCGDAHHHPSSQTDRYGRSRPVLLPDPAVRFLGPRPA